MVLTRVDEEALALLGRVDDEALQLVGEETCGADAMAQNSSSSAPSAIALDSCESCSDEDEDRTKLSHLHR